MTGWLDQILHEPKTRPGPALQLDPRVIKERIGVGLPESHLELLTAADGLVLYDGDFRLFSVQGLIVPRIVDWNDLNTWKFAWPTPLGDYLCFGETAWGDQYAYALDELTSGSGGAVYFLDALRMQPRQLTSGFADFGARYLSRNSVAPFDSMLRQAYSKFGPLPSSTHLMYVPPLLVTGEESLANVTTMNDRQAMIVNGDLWSQLSEAPEDAAVERLQATEDDQGRGRIRVVWSKQASG